MTLSPKNLLTIASVSILMAGASAAIAQEAVTPAPEETVAAETIETVETPKVEIFTREAVEDAVAETEAMPETTVKVVEDADTMVDANKIDASSETVIPAEEVAEETVEEMEETVQPEQ